ncbi:hypothetical protein [Flavobacterium tructae]|uniref:Uncharacterized protein n=1 Tax=Flavobacterium tructae TaxID=1114873 RepID=A0A1S1J8T0_9FLAO|nr:hypothetical protein [Flavobacterium tructae]OHT45855.1 hypothetical protein BHE19_08485 [Flavobacterium tructae]OXB17116.1 hypothetical protein B0A71_17775 [Flavobacterium tructae]
MYSSILEKYINDPSWTEVIKLYSGLFEYTIESNEFIKEINSINVYLAAQCSTSFINENLELESEIINKADILLNEKISSNYSIDILYINTMLELGQFEKILPFYEKTLPKNIPYLNSIIHRLFENNTFINANSLNAILKNNSNFYISKIIEFYNSSEIEIEEDQYRLIVNNLIDCKNNKTKYLIDFIKLKNEITLYIEKEKINAIAQKIDDYNDFKFWINKFDIEINYVNYVNDKVKSDISLKVSYLIFCLIVKNKKKFRNYLHSLIQNLIQREDKRCLVLGIFLISYFNKINIFKENLSSENLSLFFLIQNKINLKERECFTRTELQITKKLREINIKENLDSFKGKIYHTKVLSIWKYHYVLHSGNYGLKPSLLPFDETIETLKINDQVSVIGLHIDNKNLRLYTSQKQLKNHSLRFNPKHLNILNKDDIIKCKIFFNDERIRLSPIGLGKDFKCMLMKKYDTADFPLKSQEFVVTQVINPFFVKVLPL